MNKSLSSAWGSVRGMLPTIYSASPQSGVSFIVFDSTSFMATALGLGAIAAVLNVYFRDVQHLIGVILSAWFYLTPIIYPMEAKQAKENGAQVKPGAPAEMIDAGPIPHEYRQYFKINPFFSIIEMFHRPIYDGKFPTQSEFIAATVVAFGSLSVGLIFFGYFDQKLIFHL